MKPFRLLLPLFLLLSLLSSCASGEKSVRPGGPTGGEADEGEPADAKPYTGPPHIEVQSTRLTAYDQFLEVRFQMYGIAKLDPEPSSTYLVDEETGQKYYITWLRRIGRVATTRQGANQYLMFRNHDHGLRSGKKVTLVVGSVKVEHIVVEGDPK